MKVKFFWALAAIIFILPVFLGCSEDNASEPNNSQASLDTTVCSDGAEIKLGEYILSNNVWGKGGITNYSQCIFAKEAEGKISMGWNWSWPSGSGNVKSYPEIIYGWKPWSSSSTTEKIPLKVSEADSVNVSFELAKFEMTGIGNLAFDIWITGSAAPSPSDIRHELMIWTENKNQGPAGSFVQNAVIDGVTYAYYRGQLEWTYFAFIKSSAGAVTNVNIHKFLEFLISKNQISPDEYLSTIEFGNEVINGQGETIVRDYKIKID